MPDISAELSRENPAISSVDLKTPQRASEVFGFLTERRKTMRQRTVSTLPSLVSDAASSRSKLLPPTPDTSPSSPVSFDDRSQFAEAQIHTATVTKLSTAPAVFKRTASPHIVSAPITPMDHDPENPFLDAQDVYARERPVSRSENRNAVTARILRGPRPRSRQEPSEREGDSASTRSQTRPSSALSRGISTSGPAENEDTEPPRTPSRTSVNANQRLEFETNADVPRKPSHIRSNIPRRAGWATDDKENFAEVTSAAAVESKAAKRIDHPPITPMRARSIFDVRYPNYYDGVPLSPASSSELSPIAQDIMSNVRKERMRARDVQGPTGRVAKGSWDGE